MNVRPPYRRILLKLSGEALMGGEKFGLNHTACQLLVENIEQIIHLGTQVGIVVGGGNIFRGSQAQAFGFNRISADQMGMLSTMINGMALQQVFASSHISSCVMSAVHCPTFVKSFHCEDAIRFLENGGVPIFVAGTGNPYFTTDSAAALRAVEIKADILLKGTKVDGVYNKDPLKHKDAVIHKHLTYQQALTEHLNVMDATALALCRENKMPIRVFNIFEKGALLKAVKGEEIGSFIKEE